MELRGIGSPKSLITFKLMDTYLKMNAFSSTILLNQKFIVEHFRLHKFYIYIKIMFATCAYPNKIAHFCAAVAKINFNFAATTTLLIFTMAKIVTRRDYHLTRFRIDTFLQKGFDHLTEAEEQELQELSREMSRYEQVHFPHRPDLDAAKVRNEEKP